ncbi:IS3 family transposase [Paenibacillus flagellatus]|uniref:HTH-like domain-containing protein n=1 Tax=Paenibacillus flagellatus TaxID=2211139 RepID=A0A2V5KJI1_9BACL|nr:IS3 family transposase [Paenibacillus flagellatus]PYI50587.1 hypothetical protein DLM86_29270 [Paenibacillus flagellatus]
MTNGKKRYSMEDKIRVVCSMLLNDRTCEELAAELGVRPERIARMKRDVCAHLLRKVSSSQAAGQVEPDPSHRQQSEAAKCYEKLEWLKQTVAARTDRKERTAWIDRSPAALPLRVQTELLGLNRSTLYYRPAQREDPIKRKVAEVQTRYPYLGSRRITKLLQREGMAANRSTVRRYMQQSEPAGHGKSSALATNKSMEYQLYAFLNRQANPETTRDPVELDIPSVRLQYGWMDVFGGYH